MSETFTEKLGVSPMDEKDNTSLERGAANDIVRLRWRIKICENTIARLMVENARLRNGRVESCETVACDEASTPHVHATHSNGSAQERCTLTHEEREAIEAADAYLDRRGVHNTAVQETLRSLLERLK